MVTTPAAAEADASRAPAAPEGPGQPGPAGRRSRRSRSRSTARMDPVAWIVLALVIGILTLLVGLPIIGVLLEAFSDDGARVLNSFTTSRVNRQLFINTITLGVTVATIGTAIAFVLAYAQARMDFPFKRLVHVLTLVPIISPPFAVAAATITLFGRSGMISNGIFGARWDIYGLPGLVLVLTLSYIPLAYLNLLGMLRALDPAHEEAASSLGASSGRIFRTVTLPMLIPGFGGAFLLLFVETISDLSNPLVLGGDFQVLASRAYLAIIGEYNLGGGAAYALVLLVPAVAVFAIQRYWASRGSYVSVTGKPAGRARTVTAPAVRVPMVGFAYAVAAFVVLMYGTIVAGGFVQILGVNNTATLRHYAYVFTGVGNDAIIDTTTLALLATPIAGLLGMVTAWLVVTKVRRGAGLLDFVGMLGIAVPGTVIGIGYVISYSTPTTLFGLPILPALVGGATMFGGAVAIVMAYVAGSSPAGQRTGIAALRQIDPSLEEASASLGGSTGRTFFKVTLPLIRPALLTGLMYAFAQAMTSVSAVIFLTTPRTRILTSQIYTEVERGRFGNAFAFCTILMAIVLVAMLAINLVTRRMEGLHRR